MRGCRALIVGTCFAAIGCQGPFAQFRQPKKPLISQPPIQQVEPRREVSQPVRPTENTVTQQPKIDRDLIARMVEQPPAATRMHATPLFPQELAAAEQSAPPVPPAYEVDTEEPPRPQAKVAMLRVEADPEPPIQQTSYTETQDSNANGNSDELPLLTAPPTAEPPQQSMQRKIPQAAAAPAETEQPSPEPKTFGIANIQFCTRIDGFQRVQAMEPNFKPGQATLLYVEVAHPQGRMHDGKYETTLHAELTLVDESGTRVTLPVPTVVDRSDQPREDFYCHFSFRIPATLAPGKHQVEISLRCGTDSKVASAATELNVTSNNTPRTGD